MSERDRPDDEILRLAEENARLREMLALRIQASRKVVAERARIRPLLERCEALVRAQVHLNQRLRRPDEEAGALLGDLLADLRRELGRTPSEEP